MHIFTCSTSLLSGQIKPFQDLNYESLDRLKPRQWLNDELVLTGIRYALLFLNTSVFSNIQSDWAVATVLADNPNHPPIHVMHNQFYTKLRCVPAFETFFVVDHYFQ
jgi:hypothetical protein